MSQPIENKGAANYADIVALPEHLTGEIIDGELFVSPRPASPHARASSGMGGALYGFDGDGGGGPGGWWIIDQPELHVAGQVLVPDLAGWRRATMPEFPSTAAFEVPPDWVCEVLSPKNGRVDRYKKMPKYASFGVTHAWLVDPDARCVEVYRNQSGNWLWIATHEGDVKARIEPFEAIELDVGRWWVPTVEPKAGGEP